MPASKLHEALVLLFRDRPSLAGTLLAEVHPEGAPHFESASLASEKAAPVHPSPLDCDAVVKLEAGGRVVATVLVEVQLVARAEKRFSWQAYVAFAYHQHRCPAHLLVVTIDAAVARWAARPIHLGPPGLVLTPQVVGPAGLPFVIDPIEATRTPELAVLSAVAHARSDRAILQGPALVAGLGCLDEDAAQVYLDVVLARLVPAARAALEALMIKGYVFQSDFAKKYIAMGREEGREAGREAGREEAKAGAVLAVLEARGLPVPDALAARIRASHDLAELDRWVRRSVTVSRAEELLEQ